MKAYELLFFVAPSIDEESRAAVMKRIETTIAEGEGTVDISMPIPLTLLNSIAFFASMTPLCAI